MVEEDIQDGRVGWKYCGSVMAINNPSWDMIVGLLRSNDSFPILSDYYN